MMKSGREDAMKKTLHPSYIHIDMHRKKKKKELHFDRPRRGAQNMYTAWAN